MPNTYNNSSGSDSQLTGGKPFRLQSKFMQTTNPIAQSFINVQPFESDYVANSKIGDLQLSSTCYQGCSCLGKISFTEYRVQHTDVSVLSCHTRFRFLIDVRFSESEIGLNSLQYYALCSLYFAGFSFKCYSGVV